MSKLEEMSVEYRNKLIAKNTYNTNDNYSTTHPNAISDGDNKGKGENNNSVGSLTDIQTRESLITKNKYNKNDPYNESNV